MKQVLIVVILALVLAATGSCAVDADLDTTQQETNICPLPPGDHTWSYWHTDGPDTPWINRATYTNQWYETCNTSLGMPGTRFAVWQVEYEIPGYAPLYETTVVYSCVSCFWF